MSTGIPPISPPLDLYGPLYGSLYFSAIIPAAFYGITCMQTLFYYVHYQNDFSRMKIFVAILWVLDTIHEALVISGAWKYISAGLMDISTFLIVPPDLVFQMILTTLISLVAQGFFVYRIYIFSKKNIVAPLVWLILAIVQIVAGYIWVGKALYRPNGIQTVLYTELSDYSFMTEVTIAFSVAAGVDILIAIFLTYLLLRKRFATGFTSTSHILQRLTVFAVNTGIWTAVFALLTMITLHAFPTYAIYAVFGMPLSSIYCNTVLANLNARAYVRGVALPHNVDADLFTISSTLTSDSTKTDKQDGDSKMVPSSPGGIWKTTEVLRFPDANRSTTSGQI